MMQLPINLVGFRQAGPNDAIGKTLIRVSWPSGQSLKCAWRLELNWENDEVWIIQGQPTLTDSGHEMSSIRIEELPCSSLPKGFRRDAIDLKGFVLRDIQVASAVEADVKSDCAIALLSISGERVVIAAAPAPGAIAVKIGRDHLPKTEFNQSDFVWRRLSSP